jgi:HNH endonuclease
MADWIGVDVPESTCLTQPCTGEPVADGLCADHHTEARLALLKSFGRGPGSKVDPVQRFWAYADRSGGPDACWPWTGGIEKPGYGFIFVNGGKPRLQKAHRFSYEHFIGPIPDGLEIDHTCHTKACPVPGMGDPHRRCVNPRHLEAVTRPVNMQRSTRPDSTRAQFEKYRESVTHCSKGHEYTPENTQWRKIKGGYWSRRCAQCNRDSTMAWKAAKFASGELSPEILAARERERQRRKRQAS